MHNIVISFSINCTTTKIIFVNTLLCQIKCYSNFTVLLPKNLAFEIIINNVRNITKSDPAI